MRSAVFVAEGEVYSLDARKVHRSHAHGARVSARIHDGAAQVWVLGDAAGIAQRKEFGVGGGIAADVGFIDAACDDFTVADKYGAERASAELNVLAGKLDGFAHGGWVGLGHDLLGGNGGGWLRGDRSSGAEVVGRVVRGPGGEART